MGSIRDGYADSWRSKLHKREETNRKRERKIELANLIRALEENPLLADKLKEVLGVST